MGFLNEPGDTFVRVTAKCPIGQVWEANVVEGDTRFGVMDVRIYIQQCVLVALGIRGHVRRPWQQVFHCANVCCECCVEVHIIAVLAVFSVQTAFFCSCP